MKILITGGAGFIGSALVRHLIANTKNSVINVDKLTYSGNLYSLAEVHDSKRYTFIKEDICNRKKLDEIFLAYKPDAVIHLAAESHVDRSIVSPDAFIQTNIIGTYSLLEATRFYLQNTQRVICNQFKFLHVSTDEVFGSLENPRELFTEDTAYSPSSPYSASKASSDHLVRAWHRTYNFPAIITNCSNNYGPFQYPEKLIPLVISKAQAGQSIPVYGNGLNIRDWLYVGDHVRALLTVLERGVIGESYNIGGFNEKSNIDVVKSICDLLQTINAPKSPEICSYQDLITYVQDRPGHDARYAIDAAKIRTQLDWQPAETFESGLEKTVLWYVRNQTWLNNTSQQSVLCPKEEVFE